MISETVTMSNSKDPARLLDPPWSITGLADTIKKAGETATHLENLLQKGRVRHSVSIHGRVTYTLNEEMMTCVINALSTKQEKNNK